MYRFERERGAVLILAFVILVGLSGVLLAFLAMVSHEIRSVGAGLRNMEAFYIAEAGRAKARWALTAGGQVIPWGETVEPFGPGKGTYIVTTDYFGPPEDQRVIITSSGYIPDNINPIARRKVVEKDIPVTSGYINLSLAATASASSETGAFIAAKANDGDSSSKWKSAVDNGSWLKMDYGSSTSFDKIIFDGSKIDSYVIEYSNDDSTWVEMSNPVEDPIGTVTFDSVSVRYLRFSVTGNKPEINEFESYYIAGGESAILAQGTFVTSW